MTHDVICMIPKIGGFFRLGGAIFPPVVDGECEMCEFIANVREDERRQCTGDYMDGELDMLTRCVAVADGFNDEYVGDGFERERFALSLVSTCLRALREVDTA